jgi:hypothetical protein
MPGEPVEVGEGAFGVPVGEVLEDQAIGGGQLQACQLGWRDAVHDAGMVGQPGPGVGEHVEVTLVLLSCQLGHAGRAQRPDGSARTA